MWAFYSPHLNWYIYAFLLHSSAVSARLRVLSVYGGAILTAFSIVTMLLYRWSSQSPRIIAIVVTHAHSLPHSLPQWWDIAGTEIAGWFRFTQSYWSKLHWFHQWVKVHRLFWCSGLSEENKFDHMTNSFISHCKLLANLFPDFPTVSGWNSAAVTHNKLSALVDNGHMGIIVRRKL